MKICLYCICRNEAHMMPYLLRHYEPWVNKLIFYDGNSTDGTRELISACPRAELRNWPGSDSLCDDEFLEFANTKWKDVRGYYDWVIWIDADEFLYHPFIRNVLLKYLEDGVTVPQIAGFTMVSDKFPTTQGQIYEEVRRGFPDDIWNKPAIFREDMAFTMGRHGVDWTRCKFISSPRPEIKLLHMRALGLDYVRERHARNWARVPEKCRRLNLGDNTSPDYVGHHSVDWFAERIKEHHPLIV